MKRAIRRHHLARMKEKAKQIYHNVPDAHKWANHLAFCSWQCCGNPRRWFNEAPIQERRYLQGLVADWLCRGLQPLATRFDSGPFLQFNLVR